MTTVHGEAVLSESDEEEIVGLSATPRPATDAETARGSAMEWVMRAESMSPLHMIRDTGRL